jgi:structural maintenance of chromosome 4
VEKVNRLKVAEKERDNLSGSKLEAEAFIEKEKDIRRKKNALFQVMEHAALAQAADVAAKQEKATEKLQGERAKHSDTEKRLAVIQAEYERVKADHDRVAAELEKSTMVRPVACFLAVPHRSCSALLGRRRSSPSRVAGLYTDFYLSLVSYVVQQYDAFERNDVKLQEDMRHAKANIKKQQTAIAKEEKREEECLKEGNETKVQMAKYEALITDFQGKKAEEEAALEKIMEGLQEATAELRVSLEAAQAKLMVQEKAVASLQTEKESVETAVTLLQTRATTAAKSRGAAEDKLAKLRADREALTASAQEMEGPRKVTLNKSAAAAEESIAACVAEEARLQTAVREAVTAAEIGKAALAAQQSRSGSNVVVQKLLQATKRGNPLAAAGVRGRLGDLAAIASEYDVAISTACGMLDHIVVDTADGAQACINHLREANLGRASFIALDQIGESAARMRAAVKLPAGAARLFDLIQAADESLRPAFFLALGNTLVAADLDQAVKTAYEGDRAVWRVVTLDGNLIDTSGAMSGGGKEMRSGGMKLISGSAASGKNAKPTAVAADADEEYTPARIQQLESRVVALQGELSTCRAKKTTAEAQLVDVKKQLKELHTELEKARMALSRFGEQETDLVQRIAQISRECELSAEEQREVTHNQQRLEEIEMQISKVSPNFRTMQAEVASLQRQILNVGGPKLTKVQQKIDSLTAQLENFSSNLSTKSVEEANSRKQAEKAAVAKTKAEQELTKAEGKLADLVAQQKQMEADAMEVVNAVEAAKGRMAGLETQLQTSSKEFHDLKSLVGKFKAVEIDLGEEVSRLAGELKEHKITAKRWGQEAEAVRKQHIDEQKEFLAVVRSVEPVLRPSAAAPKSADSPPASPMKVCAAGDESVPVPTEEEQLEQLPVYTAEQVADQDTEELKKDINALEMQKNK